MFSPIVFACNLTSQKRDAEEYEFEDSLGYTVKVCSISMRTQATLMGLSRSR